MKRWAIVTVALYGLLLLALSAVGSLMLPSLSSGGFKSLVAEWGYWVWFGVLLAAQALLLLVPVDISRARLTPRRRLYVPALTATFLLANLVFAGGFAVAAALAGDDAFKVIEAPANFAENILGQFPGVAAALDSIGLGVGSGLFEWSVAIGILAGLWLIWGFLFFHYARGDEAAGLMRRTTRWLLRASILELLVAIPSHIIVRQRSDCCAPAASFWGIVTGISVMLMAFGPGVFFLFAKRIRHARRGRDPV